MTTTKRPQTITEEWFNTISHGITALTAIGGLVVLIVMSVYSTRDWALFSALFYGISLVLLYSASAIYHGVQHQKAKRILMIMDHCAIFLLIAGTYTPILLMVIGGTWGWTVFGIQWGMALLGIVLKMFYAGRYEAISLTMYALMGWAIVFKINYLYQVLPLEGFGLLVAGGLAYTAGIVFYVLDHRVYFAHFIWHLFVLAGSLLHYLLMVMYIF
ncbi:MAG: hemolysin III family protein [Microscillaceae bacterium]|jgi:hemolysin III|nr:hemolysin III family protein [Microscillaceae bacterium]